MWGALSYGLTGLAFLLANFVHKQVIANVNRFAVLIYMGFAVVLIGLAFLSQYLSVTYVPVPLPCSKTAEQIRGLARDVAAIKAKYDGDIAVLRKQEDDNNALATKVKPDNPDQADTYGRAAIYARTQIDKEEAGFGATLLKVNGLISDFREQCKV